MGCCRHAAPRWSHPHLTIDEAEAGLASSGSESPPTALPLFAPPPPRRASRVSPNPQHRPSHGSAPHRHTGCWRQTAESAQALVLGCRGSVGATPPPPSAQPTPMSQQRRGCCSRTFLDHRIRRFHFLGLGDRPGLPVILGLGKVVFHRCRLLCGVCHSGGLQQNRIRSRFVAPNVSDVNDVPISVTSLGAGRCDRRPRARRRMSSGRTAHNAVSQPGGGGRAGAWGWPTPHIIGRGEGGRRNWGPRRGGVPAFCSPGRCRWGSRWAEGGRRRGIHPLCFACCPVLCRTRPWQTVVRLAHPQCHAPGRLSDWAGRHRRTLRTSPPPTGMHWKGRGLPPPPPLQGAQPVHSHCPPDAKCEPQWHL